MDTGGEEKKLVGVAQRETRRLAEPAGVAKMGSMLPYAEKFDFTVAPPRP